jgi:hypothetical protein
MTEDTMIAALLRERAGLVQRGLTERVAQVDEQLAHRGYTPEDGESEQGAAKTPAPAKKTEAAAKAAPPRGRQARSPETT